MYPSLSITTPEPVPPPSARRTSIITTDFSTACATLATWLRGSSSLSSSLPERETVSECRGEETSAVRRPIRPPASPMTTAMTLEYRERPPADLAVEEDFADAEFAVRGRRRRRRSGVSTAGALRERPHQDRATGRQRSVSILSHRIGSRDHAGGCPHPQDGRTPLAGPGRGRRPPVARDACDHLGRRECAVDAIGPAEDCGGLLRHGRVRIGAWCQSRRLVDRASRGITVRPPRRWLRAVVVSVCHWPARITGLIKNSNPSLAAGRLDITGCTG